MFQVTPTVVSVEFNCLLVIVRDYNPILEVILMVNSYDLGDQSTLYLEGVRNPPLVRGFFMNANGFSISGN